MLLWGEARLVVAYNKGCPTHNSITLSWSIGFAEQLSSVVIMRSGSLADCGASPLDLLTLRMSNLASPSNARSLRGLKRKNMCLFATQVWHHRQVANMQDRAAI